MCQAAGGYVKLARTRQQDSTGPGFTEFEFALRGSVVRADRAKPHTSRSTADSSRSSHDSMPPSEPTTTGIADPNLEHPPPAPPPPPASPVVLPTGIRVVIVDDSGLNRRAALLRMQRISNDLAQGTWTFAEFPTVEAAQPHLREITSARTVVMLDHNLSSEGGRLSGSDAILFLTSIDFPGCIVSASGDPEVGKAHVLLGAHLNWAKPLPNRKRMIADLAHFFRNHNDHQDRADDAAAASVP